MNSVTSSRITIVYLLMALKKVTELLLLLSTETTLKCVRLPDAASIFRAELYALLLAIDVIRHPALKRKEFCNFF